MGSDGVGRSASSPPPGPRRDLAPVIPGPLFIRWFGAIFVLISLGVLVWGFVVAGGVRRAASETDNAMRTVAWELLRWSAGHEGRFPRSEAEFLAGIGRAVEPPPPPPPAVPGGAPAWPRDQRSALLRHPPAHLPIALARVSVLWPPRPEVAPEVLPPEGRPTLPGTIEDVRGWLHAWVDHHRLRPPVRRDAPEDRDATRLPADASTDAPASATLPP